MGYYFVWFIGRFVSLLVYCCVFWRRRRRRRRRIRKEEEEEEGEEKQKKNEAVNICIVTGFSFEAGGRMFRLVVCHYTSGTLRSILAIFFLLLCYIFSY